MRHSVTSKMPIAAALPYIVAAAGTAASVYGANKQASAVSDANAANQATQAQQNQASWNNYLLTRGVYGNNAPTGTIPQGAQAVNTKLPLWATVARAPTGGVNLSAAGPGAGAGLNWWNGGNAPVSRIPQVTPVSAGP